MKTASDYDARRVSDVEFADRSVLRELAPVLPRSSPTVVDDDLSDVPLFELPGADLSGEELTVAVIPVRNDESRARAASLCSTAAGCAAPRVGARSAPTAREHRRHLPAAAVRQTGAMDGVLVFDGRCGMCTRVCNRLAKLNRTGGLRIEPFQAPGMAERLGFSAEGSPESAWWLDASGTVFAGAKAMNAALSAALGTTLPLWIYRLPGVGAAQDAIYRWVAAHRYRFRGVTPLCEAEPQRCA